MDRPTPFLLKRRVTGYHEVGKQGACLFSEKGEQRINLAETHYGTLHMLSFLGPITILGEEISLSPFYRREN